jgi:hemerythrin-like domain-containing protein
METMLVQIGQRTAHEDLVDLLAECHTRIRRFLELARTLAANRTAPESEAHDVAAQIRRYFSSAFPHHLRDEDQLIAPRLAGSSTKIDEVMRQLHEDHVQHAESIAYLVGICADIERDPRQLAQRAGELRHAAAVVTEHLEPHLELEERELFPAVRGLSADAKAAIRSEMRQQRESDFAQ